MHNTRMSHVLLLLNHNFVAEAGAELLVAQKKQELHTQHPGAQVDQFLLSNVVMDKVSLQKDYYDSIYYLDSAGFNQTIPNHPAIKASLKTSQTVALNKPSSSTSATGIKPGSKLSKLKFKKLNKPASSPVPELLQTPSAQDAEKKLRFFEDSEDDEELIDEDTLVTSTLNTGSIICLREPSSGGKKRRKACKDCTCGLAEQEAFGFAKKEEQTKQVQFSKEELSEIDFTVEGKTGGCGSCSLGDAFRCSGCPFLGLPAFQPGQAITLDGIDDDL